MSNFANMAKKFSFVILLFSAVVYFMSCSENSVGPAQNNVDLSYISSADTTDSAILNLDTVKLLLKDIKLNVANSSDSTNFKVGPYVLFLDLTTSVNIIGSAYIPPGTYDKIQFEVHKLNDNETVPDPEFADINGRYSVVAKGSYNGVRFVYKSDKSAKQKLNFPNSLVVSQTGVSNVTIKVSPYIWFIDESTGQYMDPNDPASRNNIDNNIKENIKASFKAFKDNDKNGIPD